MRKCPSLNVIQPSYPREESFFAPKFEDRSQEETHRQDRWPRREAWDLVKQVYEVRGIFDQNEAMFFSRSLDRCMPAPSMIKLEEREFVVDSSGLQRIC